MALGHGPQILNELNTAKLTGKPSEGFIEDLGKHIRYQWYMVGEQILDDPSDGYLPEKQMLEEGYKYQRSAVEYYRKGILSGISPKDLDQAIQKLEIPRESFNSLKNAVADLTSGKYPLSDLSDWTPPDVSKSGVPTVRGSEQAIVNAEVKAIQAAGIGATEAEAASSVKNLLSIIKHAKTIAGGEVGIAIFIVENAVGALHQLIVKDPSQAESLARLIAENKESGINRNLNNVVEH